MIIKNSEVFSEKNGFEKKDIYIDGEYISNTPNGDEIDCSNCYAFPGFVDIHFHGCMSSDFCDATYESLSNIAEYQLKNGVMAICPASMTLDEEELHKIFKNAANYKNENGSDLVGINMEGPFISLQKKGAQNPKYIVSANVDMFNRLQQSAKSLIKICDIAVEDDSVFEFIRKLKDDVVISLCHTTAGYDMAKKAYDSGAKHLTHMYNAMNGMNHRDAGPIGAAFDSDKVRVELIADGVHISPTMIRVAFKLFGEDRVILVSDSMEATGMPDGEYSLGGQKVYVKGNKATLEDGTIAGSVTNLYKCMVNAVKNMDVDLHTAVKSSSVNPSKQIGIFDKYGSIENNKYANIIIADKDTLEIKHLIFKGKLIK